MATTLNEYDELPYEGSAWPTSHTSHLAAVARLYGLNPPLPDQAHVLEIGCANGENLIPMAYGMPAASFVGIDYSVRQIETATATAQALGLKNIQFAVADIRSFSGPRSFDYVIAHGVFSWVSSEIQEALLQLCRNCLRPDGVAMVDYNVLPGWHLRHMAREIMQAYAERFSSREEGTRRGLEFLEFIAACQFHPKSPYAEVIKSLSASLQHEGTRYIAHDFMELENNPVYFRDFARRAAAKGLTVVADAQFAHNVPQEIAGRATQKLNELARDHVEWEQYMDFLMGREFRQTLLVGEHQKSSRGPVLEAFPHLFFSSSARATSPSPDLRSTLPEDFQCDNGPGLMATNPVLKAALRLLADAWPAGVAFNHLLSGVRKQLLGITSHPTPAEERLFAEIILPPIWNGVIQIRGYQPRLAVTLSERPTVSDVARHEALGGRAVVTTMLHQAVGIDPLGQAALPLLDGSHTRDAVASELIAITQRDTSSALAQAASAQTDRAAWISQGVDQLLSWGLRIGLLVG